MTCPQCGDNYEIGDWPLCPHGRATLHVNSVHASERAVKFHHPEHGWRTPGRADRPMSPRLQQLGFQRVEFDSYRALDQHGKQTGARSEVLDYDNSGHADKEYT